MNFKDLFSGQSADYSKFRPTYPLELYAYLASLTRAHDLAWDCGTGNGQAALPLAKYFKHVIATDPSQKQLDQATRVPNVEYRCAPAENSGLDSGSVDLITVAQAYHWFRHEEFHREARRVAKPGRAALAIWSYALCHITSEVDKVVAYYYDDVIGKYWEPERKLVETGYRTLPVPFNERSTPDFEMKTAWSVEHFIGYLNTWSATQAAARKLGKNPLEEVAPVLAQAWGAETNRVVTWPVSLRVFDL